MPIPEPHKAKDKRLRQFQQWTVEPLGLYTTDPLLEYLEALEKRVELLENEVRILNEAHSFQPYQVKLLGGVQTFGQMSLAKPLFYGQGEEGGS